MQLKNLLFQPLTLHLSVDNKGLHINARECLEIATEHISEEIRLAATRGLVSLIDEVDDGPDHALSSEVAEETPQSATEAGELQVRQKKGNRR